MTIMTKYKNKNENRIDWVDISKGLGIILVIRTLCISCRINS